MRMLQKCFSSVFFIFVISGCGGDGGGGSGEQATDSWVLRWNQIIIDASGLDHSPVQAGESRVFGEQLGPTKASRAAAIAHIAMFDALNAIELRYNGYAFNPAEPPLNPASMKAAAAQAAHDALQTLYPSQAASFASFLAEDLSHISDEAEKAAGIELGKSAARAILSARENDGSEQSKPGNPLNYTPSNQPGHWRSDPLNPGQTPHGPRWKEVMPFALTDAAQMRVPPPPALNSVEYAEAFNEVKSYGGDGVLTPTVRNEDQTVIGIFWAYDGTPSLCAPPRLYNQVARSVMKSMGTRDPIEVARVLTLVNIALADAGIGIWESKYFYDVWRPISGIREADVGTGPTGRGDNNPATVGDASFIPLGAPASNLAGPNFTPPFPSYPSGHAGFGGALFEVLRNYYGTDDIAFSFVSDEYNGVTLDNAGAPRPRIERHYSTLSEAEYENAISRVYLGIHWRFDVTTGIEQGRNIAGMVSSSLLTPR